ncbi:Cu,Zn superoxide dismutase-like protein [Amniculicola lignicola CBS 123094]|uniref:superoxide dismutase n=1 Tax=Amniculicola lignicola CBS 123094 TaxID=1392246 RepID=A0A6A5W0A1_9PLEO|nr:Cu,Zn superoxide dismutase-like protein [Amniculicola lignicola CBS 123094]
MLSATLYSLLAVAAGVAAQTATPSAQDAPLVTNNPIGASYVAVLPKKDGSSLGGSIQVVSGPGGKGAKFAVSISGLPAEGGPFMYHIHEKPVPENGNCTATGAHLDPYKRGEIPLCNPEDKKQCQTGDLSGKYGNITGSSLAVQYEDLFTSLTPGTPAFFGNLSFVVHLSNKTRIGCANFQFLGGGISSVASSGYAAPTGAHHGGNSTISSPTLTGTGSPYGNGGTPTSSSTNNPQNSDSAASQVILGAGAVLAGVMALVL